MSEDSVGRVIGTKEAKPLDFWLGVEENAYVQLDEVVAVTTKLPTPLPDGRDEVVHYGVVDAVESAYEGASFHSDVFRDAEGTLPVSVSTIAHVSVTRVAMRPKEPEAEVLVPPRPGQPVRREFEYRRHGTLCLMGAYNVRRRKLFGFASTDHDTQTFVDLLDLVDECHPDGRGHIICDNLSMHDTDDVWQWLEDHPRWRLHFTPKHASWLNQIECAFSILQAKVLARGSFRSLEELRERVYDFMLWFNAQDAAPFRWSYRPKSWGAC